MIYIGGGDYHEKDSTRIKPFLIDKYLVAVAEFEAFVSATGYVTEAEQFGDGGVFDPGMQSWFLKPGASYKYPMGKDYPVALSNHPVTQVSWNDAAAYCKWKGKRLPTRAEWELAAQEGLPHNTQYAWGNDLIIDGQYRANTWQGSFPFLNTKDDGYEFTSPVDAFPPNPSGLHDMGGNVWQWCDDTIQATAHEKIVDPSDRKVMKGGSYLCDPLVCHGYTISGMSSSTPETAMAHIGFRCASDLK
jgi:sulfatase modifying factor 1